MWLPAPLLSWLHPPPVQALPSPGSFRETLGYLHLFVLCCLHCVCATGWHKSHRLSSHVTSMFTQCPWLWSGDWFWTGWLPPMATCHHGFLKWAGFDRSVIWDLLTVELPTVFFAVNIALMSALCPTWFRKACWILPLYCEQKNSIWVVFIFIIVTQPNKSVCNSSHLASVVMNSEVSVLILFTFSA